MDAKVEVEGLEQVLRDLRRMGDKEIPKAIRVANLDAAKVVAPVAAAEAPKRSGRLAKSIKARATQRAGSLKAGTAQRVPYAGPIHFGWHRRNIRPNPFIYRAVAKNIARVRDVYERKMSEVAARFNAGR